LALGSWSSYSGTRSSFLWASWPSSPWSLASWPLASWPLASWPLASWTSASWTLASWPSWPWASWPLHFETQFPMTLDLFLAQPYKLLGAYLGDSLHPN